MWGCSSAGRAPALQAGGQEFDSPHLHHNLFLRDKYEWELKKVNKVNTVLNASAENQFTDFPND